MKISLKGNFLVIDLFQEEFPIISRPSMVPTLKLKHTSTLCLPHVFQ